MSPTSYRTAPPRVREEVIVTTARGHPQGSVRRFVLIDVRGIDFNHSVLRIEPVIYGNQAVAVLLPRAIRRGAASRRPSPSTFRSGPHCTRCVCAPALPVKLLFPLYAAVSA